MEGLPALPFDHASSLAGSLARVRIKSHYSSLPAHLCRKPFKLLQLHAANEAVLCEAIDAVSFHRKLEELDVSEVIGGAKSSGGTQRPA